VPASSRAKARSQRRHDVAVGIRHRLPVTVAALTVAVLALVVSLLSVAYTRRATHAAERATSTQEAADRRAREPRLVVSMAGNEDSRNILYGLYNDGPQDLDAVLVRRPETKGGGTYLVARVGGNFGDTVDLGRLPMGDTGFFMLAIGTVVPLPVFRVRIECQAGSDRWLLVRELSVPRDPEIW
jgi:hypothetical protein